MAKGKPLSPAERALIPEHYITLTSSPSGGLWPLHLHLRANGVPSMMGSSRTLGRVLRVPPETQERARELEDTFLAGAQGVAARE